MPGFLDILNQSEFPISVVLSPYTYLPAAVLCTPEEFCQQISDRLNQYRISFPE